MWSQSGGEKPPAMDPRMGEYELSSAWRNLNQSKAALRHIENQLEAAVGSGVVINSLNTEKTPKQKRRGRRSADGDEAAVKPRPQSQRSTDKSSRSPLRTSTQDNTHTSHRPASSPPDASLSRQVYDRDCRPLHSADADSTRSSVLDATTVRVLNDSPALQRSEVTMGGSEFSPGSARLEKLRQRQTDEKLEKLKERIRRQREQLEEATDRGRERVIGAGQGNSTHQQVAKVRKVAAAPPAPNYKGFNSSEVKIRSSDGRVWGEDEFHLNPEIYLTERAKRKPVEKEKQQERKLIKPVRKIHRSASVPEPKPAISVSSWREGQKVVKMMLGPLQREPRAQSEGRERRTGEHRTDTASCSGSVPRPESGHRSRPSGAEKPAVTQISRAAGGARGKEQPPDRSSRPPVSNRVRESAVTQTSRPQGGAGALSASLELLPADIRGILDDLHLEDGARSRDAGRVGRKRAGQSPSKPRPESAERALPRKRHYDTDAVRRYIAKQQEERKRRQAEEKQSQREEQERRSQRLQELYKKQREGVAKQQVPPPNLINSRLQETYTKILLEHTLQGARPVYQPSGESDKENKRLEQLSPSTSELSEHTPSPLCRSDLVPPAGQFFSHLLSLEPECVNSTTHLRDTHTVDTHQVRTGHADTHTTSRLNRIEALKACAASLSSRIENEARKLVTYRNSDDDDDHAHWAKPPSPPERERPDSSSRIHNDVKELPGVGNLYSFITQEGWGETAKPRPLPASTAHPFSMQEEKHDSSGGSISEGLLSDGSLSDPGDDSAARHDRIALFQKEAELHTPYRPVVTSQPWEELSKGSPHSVINIFAKNINKYSNVMDTEVDIPPPALRSSPSAHSLANGVAYEDDFISSRSSSQSASKRTSNGISNSRSSAVGDEKRENDRFPHSSASSPMTSPSSAHSISKRGSEKSLERTLVDTRRSVSSFASESQRSDWRKSDSPRGSRRSADGTPGGASVHSSHSVVSEIPQFPRSPADSPRISGSSASSPVSARDSTARAGTGLAHNVVPAPEPAHSTTELQFAPVVLQQRLSAELNFLDAMEESVRQLSDVERVRAVSLAQQESVSLAQIIKAQQQRQERELQLLKLKAEQEALEAQRHVQESRERAAQAHADLCANLVQSHQKALMELQENSSKMIHQHTETAQHLREVPEHNMTEMTRSQMLNVSTVTPVRQPHPQTDSSRSEVSAEKMPTADTPQSSLAESESSRMHTGSSVRQSDGGGVDRSSSVEEEANTAADDSLQTDRADSASVNYSLKFDESVTEDELEKSFRSVLPSESHWRGSVERKRQSDEELHAEKSSTKDGSVPVFSADQYSFSEFTIAMVKQCMQEEEVRSQHQSSLLRLRHRALKEKTRAELEWLELQKRRLRDKGEDDKMPPIRKKQRGLLLKLQQEQAEIRRLQEVNRAARRERKLLLKQQEEIERIQHTTLKLREKLRNADDTNQRSPVSGMSGDLAPPTELDVEFRSPSPLSVSGSETSSIMKKLKKMNYHTDERFLTQRELRLVHWRQQVEAELRRTDGAEPQWKGRALSDRHMQLKQSTDELQRDRQEERKMGREVRSEGDSSSVLSASSIHTVQECENTHSHESPLVPASSSSKSHSNTRKRDLPSSAPTSEAASDQSDIEGRVLALRAELRRRKAEVQRLKKEQRLRHKERLKAQEASLLKQLESYNNFIQKTKAELSKADAATSAKPQIKTPTSGSHKSRTETSTPDRSETEKSFTGKSHESESEKSDRIHTESPALSDEDPPTVTPTPVLGSPNRPSPPEPQHYEHTRPESSARPETEVSANQSIASSPRSEDIEELESPRSNLSRSEHSYPVLDLTIQDANEDFSKNDSEIALAIKVSLEEEEHVNNSEDIKSSLSTKPEPEELKHPEIPSPLEVSHAPDASLMKEDSEHKPTVSPSVDSYKDDFKSAIQEEPQPQSPSSEDPEEEESCRFSFSSEEEIEEEISVKSGNTSGTFEQERPLDLDFLGKRTKESVDISSAPKSPEDEMPDYVIGDRVLVSNVQPGTLRFKGPTRFATGFWAGVELDIAEGSNNGTYDGVVYFQCKDKHGIFAPPDKISHLSETFEGRTRTSEEEDSSCDHRSNEVEKTDKSDSTLQKKADPVPPSEMEEPSEKRCDIGSKPPLVTKDLKIDPAAVDSEIFKDLIGGNHSVSLERFGDIVMELKEVSKVEEIQEDQTPDILDLLIRGETSLVTEDLQKHFEVPPEKTSEDGVAGSLVPESKPLTTLADTLMERFMSDALKQFQQIKKVKEQKISAANQLVFFGEDEELGGNNVSQLRTSSAGMTDRESFQSVFDKDHEEVSSPELCNRMESPVLGQEELVQRLEELELNREFLHVLGDEPDWFDEDFGLSSRKHVQHKNKLRQDELTSAAKLPHVRQQEEVAAAAMLVPHKAGEVEKLVSAALLEIWSGCGMERGKQSLTARPKAQASETLLGGQNSEQCVHSYKQAVFDLAWELMQEIYAEDPNTNRPLWIKPRRVHSPYIHRIDDPTDLTKVQTFVTGEVLKLYGLNKEQNHRTDWQKMLKFGRKKRDRVDHILVQELHEEEALWVNYDEDELLVKMQLADGILDTLLKDTVDVLNTIHERRSTRALS